MKTKGGARGMGAEASICQIKMQVGQQVAIPLVLRDGANLDPANRAITKTQRLIQLNVELFHALIALTKDMEKAKAEEEKAPEA